MEEVFRLTIQHLVIVFTTLLVSILVATPLAIIIYKKNFHIDLTVQIVSLLQAFPTIGLFAILVPFFGIGKNVAIISLSLYAIMPIYLNTLNGFKTINPEYYDIAKNLQLDKLTILKKIELPYVIIHTLNGIRQATIYTISLATIATLIGAGGLGDLIYLGMQQLDLMTTLSGLIPLIIMALCSNIFFNKLEKKLMPHDLLEKNGR